MAVALCIPVIVLAASVWAYRHRRPDPAQTVRRMQALAGRLAAEVHDGTILGCCNGVAFAYRFGWSSDAVGKLFWTDIDVELPSAYPLIIHVRPRRPWFGSRISAGPLREISLGDETFDAKYSVTAAPTDVVCQLLDAELQTWLSAHEGTWLDTVEEEGHKLLRLSLPGWNLDLDNAESAVRSLASIAANLRDAFAIDDGPLSQRDGDSPYRPMPDAHATAELAHHRELEVAQLRTAWAWPTRRRS